MSQDSEPPATSGRRGDEQTFLVGETLYLRPVELTDAKAAMAWRRKPFPAPSAAVEKQLEARLQIDPDEEDGRQLLVACRRSDDRVLGSVTVHLHSRRFAELSLHADAARPVRDREAIVAEMMTILVPWLLDERAMMTVQADWTAGAELVERTAADLGMRQVARLREARLVDGVRRDRLFWERLNPAWIERLGMPPRHAEGPVARPLPSPVPPGWPRQPSDPPANAVIVGDRLYLRPFEVEEGALVARWNLQETERFMPQGRWVMNPHAYGHRHQAIAEKDPPMWARFAICLRETGELIGANGLLGIDWVHATAETETEIFRKAHRQQGYGTEAKHLLLTYGFDRLGLHMIYSVVSETNSRSAAALRKQGYRDAGYLAWETASGNGFDGVFVFDLLAEEWRATGDGSADR